MQMICFQISSLLTSSPHSMDFQKMMAEMQANGSLGAGGEEGDDDDDAEEMPALEDDMEAEVAGSSTGDKSSSTKHAGIEEMN